ncbi:MAG TPA: gas vesicle protein [Vicinamibacteria bacterium]|nr:gas vesicle protein [Vicinamibacteria bacterium]
MRERDEEALIEDADASLLELVDHVLNRGVVVTGDLMLSIANVDLVYLRLSALLCAADRLFTPRR